MRESLHHIAHELGVTVNYGDLSEWNLDGYYDHESNTVWLHENLNPIIEKCTLAHELGHAHYGDVAGTNRLHTAKIEHRANRYAANLLIDYHAYRDAETVTAGTPGAIARALDVTTNLIAAYQDGLLRLGETTYIEPKHGHARHRILHV